jgi:Ca2+-binding EF-hand superfamily protein
MAAKRQSLAFAEQIDEPNDVEEEVTEVQIITLDPEERDVVAQVYENSAHIAGDEVWKVYSMLLSLGLPPTKQEDLEALLLKVGHDTSSNEKVEYRSFLSVCELMKRQFIAKQRDEMNDEVMDAFVALGADSKDGMVSVDQLTNQKGGGDLMSDVDVEGVFAQLRSSELSFDQFQRLFGKVNSEALVLFTTLGGRSTGHGDILLSELHGLYQEMGAPAEQWDHMVEQESLDGRTSIRFQELCNVLKGLSVNVQEMIALAAANHPSSQATSNRHSPFSPYNQLQRQPSLSQPVGGLDYPSHMENLRNHTASWNSDKEIAALGTSVGRNPPGTIEPGTLAVYNAQGQLVLVKISDLRSNLKKIITRHESGINHERKWEQLSQPRPSPKRRNSKPDKVPTLKHKIRAKGRAKAAPSAGRKPPQVPAAAFLPPASVSPTPLVQSAGTEDDAASAAQVQEEPEVVAEVSISVDAASPTDKSVRVNFAEEEQEEVPKPDPNTEPLSAFIHPMPPDPLARVSPYQSAVGDRYFMVRE